MNLNFEDSSGTFPAGWRVTGEVTPAPGLTGIFAARLASASGIWQDFTPAPADGLSAFQFSAQILLDGVGRVTTRTSRIRLQSEGGGMNFITMRIGPDGLDYFAKQAWQPGPRFAATLGAPFKIVVESGNLDADPQVEYRLEVHQYGKEPVRSGVIEEWNSGSNHWQGVFPRPGAGFSALSIEAGEGNTMFVDDVEIQVPAGPVTTGAASDGMQVAGSPVAMPENNLIQNPGFEAKPPTSGWNMEPPILVVGGLNGSATALQFPYQTQGNLNQKLKQAVADFTCDLSVSVARTDTSQSVRFDLRGKLQTIIEVRGGKGGFWEVKDGAVWKKIVPKNPTSRPEPALILDTGVRLRVIGRKIGQDDARYDLVWTDPGQQAWKHAATGLTAFVSPAIAPIDAIRFERDQLLTNTFTIDDVSIIPTAEAPPAADHQIGP